jgi:hypothetical protein
MFGFWAKAGELKTRNAAAVLMMNWVFPTVRLLRKAGIKEGMDGLLLDLSRCTAIANVPICDHYKGGERQCHPGQGIA